VIRHVVVLTFTDRATPAERDALAAALRALPEVIPEIRAYSCGSDLGLAEGNASFGVVADFDDVDGYVAYRDHPAHRAVLEERILPMLASRAAVQVDVR
jgi:hypothetical protein